MPEIRVITFDDIKPREPDEPGVEGSKPPVGVLIGDALSEVEVVIENRYRVEGAQKTTVSGRGLVAVVSEVGERGKLRKRFVIRLYNGFEFKVESEPSRLDLDFDGYGPPNYGP